MKAFSFWPHVRTLGVDWQISKGFGADQNPPPSKALEEAGEVDAVEHAPLKLGGNDFVIHFISEIAH